MSLPPIFFYAIGTFMAVFGLGRALILGRRRKGGEGSQILEDTPAQAKARRNHRIFGIVHCIFGIVLILLTSGVIRSRLGH
jgi:hypothetical protein